MQQRFCSLIFFHSRALSATRYLLKQKNGRMVMIANDDFLSSALCREHDVSIFFPNSGSAGNKAKKICAECSVKIECLEYALKNNIQYGMWGGVSERGRKKMKVMAA